VNDVSGGVLVEADHVSARIAEPRRDLGGVRANGLHDLAAMGYNRVNRRSHTVNHDVKQEAGLSRRRAPEHHVPLTSLTESLKAVLPSPRLRMVQPKTLL